MDFQEVVARRRSTRAYSSEAVHPGALDRILRSAVRAPSAGNLQAYRVIVVTSAGRRKDLARAAGDQAFLLQAPLDLVFFADPDRSEAKYGERGARLYSVQDATIAATFAVLAATNEGLASAWVGAFDDTAVRAVCGEVRRRPVAIIPVGHEGERPDETPRRPLSSLVREL